MFNILGLDAPESSQKGSKDKRHFGKSRPLKFTLCGNITALVNLELTLSTRLKLIS